MKNHYFTFKVVLVLCMTFSMFSCKKTERPLIENASTSGKTKFGGDSTFYRYFENDTEVTDADISLYDSTKVWLVKIEGQDSTDIDTVSYYAFDTPLQYWEFGTSVGVNFELFDKWTSDLLKFAVIYGYLPDLEAGIIPKGYEEMVYDYLTKNGGAYLYAKNFGPTGGFWNKFCPGGSGATTAYKKIVPIINLGWNDAIRSFYPIGIYGCNIVYDRTVFRNKMVTYWGWAFRAVSMCDTWWDQRASSWLKAI